MSESLNKTKHLTSDHVTVLARGGIVTLNGTVPTAEEIPLAGDTARNVQGVTRVTNNLTVHEEGQ